MKPLVPPLAHTQPLVASLAALRRILLGLLRDRGLRLVLATALVLVVSAYQVPVQLELSLVSPRSEPFLRHFFAPQWTATEAYRWTRNRSSLIVTGLGSGTPLRMTIRALGWRPDDVELPQVSVRLDGREIGVLHGERAWETYVVEIPAGRNPEQLQLNLISPTFVPGADPRELGVGVSSIVVDQPGPWQPVLPSPRQALLFVMLGAALYGLSRRVGLGASRAARLALAALIPLAALLAFARPYYGAFSPYLPALILWNLVLALVAPPLVGRLFARGGVRLAPAESAWVWLVALAGFDLRWVLQFYPHEIIGDSLFHLHRLDAVAAGQVLLTSSAGAIGFERAIPYPSALYLILTPLVPLWSDHYALLRSAACLLDVVAALAVFYLVRRAAGRLQPALLALALALFLPIAVLNFAWSIYANLLAQAALVLAVTLWALQARTPSRASRVFLFAAVLVAALAHITGPILLVAFALVAALLLWFAFPAARAALVVRPLLLTAAAVVLAGLLFYSSALSVVTEGASGILSTRLERGGENRPIAIVGGGVKYPAIGLIRVPVHTLAGWITQGALGLAREAWVYFAAWPLVLAPLGLLRSARRARAPDLSLGASSPGDPVFGRVVTVLASAGLVTGLAFALLGVVLDVYVRYPLFLVPFISIGAGLALDALIARGHFPRLVVLALLALTLPLSLLLWAFFF